MAQWSRTLTALSEDLDSIFSTHMVAHQLAPSFIQNVLGSSTSSITQEKRLAMTNVMKAFSQMRFLLLGFSSLCEVYTHICTHAHHKLPTFSTQ